MEQEVEAWETVIVEPSPERGILGPSREAPRREPIGPKRAAPPRDPDANQPNWAKRPARAPVHGPEPDAEPADRANRRPVSPAVAPPAGANPRLPPIPPLEQRAVDLPRG
eukprot:3504675-Amphidinium_carterae.1